MFGNAIETVIGGVDDTKSLLFCICLVQNV